MHQHPLIRDLMTKMETVVRNHNARKTITIDVWLGAQQILLRNIEVED